MRAWSCTIAFALKCCKLLTLVRLCRAEHRGHAGAQHRLVSTAAGYDSAVWPLPCKHEH